MVWPKIKMLSPTLIQHLHFGFICDTHVSPGLKSCVCFTPYTQHRRLGLGMYFLTKAQMVEHSLQKKVLNEWSLLTTALTPVHPHYNPNTCLEQ